MKFEKIEKTNNNINRNKYDKLMKKNQMNLFGIFGFGLIKSSFLADVRLI